MDDFTALTTRDHWLGWLGDDPSQAVRREIEGLLRAQTPSARLDWLRLAPEPDFLTGGRRSKEAPDKIIVTRAGLATSFELQVSSDEGTQQLRGVFSWVASGLDGERRDRVFLDLDAEMAWASDQLKLRLYETDAEPAEVKEVSGRRPWWKFGSN